MAARLGPVGPCSAVAELTAVCLPVLPQVLWKVVDDETQQQVTKVGSPGRGGGPWEAAVGVVTSKE